MLLQHVHKILYCWYFRAFCFVDLRKGYKVIEEGLKISDTGSEVNGFVESTNDGIVDADKLTDGCGDEIGRMVAKDLNELFTVSDC